MRPYYLNNYKYHYESRYNLINLSDKSTYRNYIGQNGFGAVSEVTSSISEETGIALENTPRDDKSIIQTIIKSTSDEAKFLKKDLAFFVEFNIGNLEPSEHIFLNNYLHSNATIAEPLSISHTMKYIPVTVRRICIFHKSDGKTVDCKQFRID